MATDARVKLHCSQADKAVDRFLDRARGEPPRELVEHVASCARCRRLYSWVLGPGEPVELPNGVQELISRKLKESLQPVKPLPSAGRLAARFAGTFGLFTAALVAYFGPGGAAQMSVVQLVVVTAVLLTAAVLLAASLSWQMTPGSLHRIPLSWLVGAFVSGFTLVVAVLFPWERASQILSGGWACTYHGVLIAVPPGAAMLYLAARGAPLSYRTLGATVGAAAGLLSLTVLQFSCENQHAGHLLLWHGAVLALSTAAGYLAGWAAEQLALRRREP